MGLVKEIDEEEEEKWDKIRAWDSVQQDIRSRLNEPEKFDQSMTLNHGPQLFHTLRHASSIKCMTHFTSTIGDNFMTHYRIGTIDHLSLWALESKERDALSKHNRFTIHSELRCLLYVPQHKVYFGFGTDLVMRVYTDSRSQCQEVGAIPCDTTILCMSYCKDTNEVFAGGIGTLEKWRVKGSEHSAVATRGEKFDLELRSDEWVIDVKVDPRNKQLLALTYDGIYVANYQTMKQTHHLQNRHDGSLRCCSFYKQREYFITGGGDGLVKVWNAVVFSQVHVFYGHRDAITALQVHKTDPLLFSSSLDGTVQIWRMDNFCKFMRVDLGDPVHQMKLLGDEEFFCQTEKQIKIYNLNQFYHLYAPVESSVYKLQLCQGSKTHPSRIICSTEDGSVRFFSPTTGATITIIYPMPTFQVLTCFAYCRDKERLMTVLQNGDVLVFNCETNPCKAEEIWQATSHDEEVTSLVLVSLMYEGIEGANIRDSVIFGGLRNGQIALMEAANCVMVKNVQAHEGAITCMEYATEIDGSGFQMMETSKTLVTGGDDSFLKIWNIVIVPGHTGDQISLEVILKIHCKSPPQYVSMYENTLCLTLSRTKESRCCMEMYRLDSSDPGNPGAPLQYTQLHHAADEDHTDQITAVDKCPLLGLFVTSGVDGYIKVWNRHNQLVREMGFGEPLFGLCFANPRGDLLVGYQNHVCLIPLTSFFPHNYLERITLQNFKDESKENVIPYNPRVKPWFDAKKLPKFSTSLSVRTQERNRPEPEEILEDLEAEEEEREEQARRRLEEERTIIEEEILRRLEKRRLERAFRDSHRPITREETEATSFLGSPTPSEEEALKSPAHTPEGITPRKAGQTTSKAGQITSRAGATTPGIGGVVPKGGALTPRPGTITPRGGGSVFKPGPRGSQEGLITSPDTSIDADFEFDIDTPRSIKKKKTVKFEKKEDKGRRGSGMANLHLLTPFERALLKRKPIIALDGYIPNSVIRKQLGFRPPTPPMMPPSREVWTPKPVPVPKPSHVPGYEEEEPMDLYEDQKPFFWGDGGEEPTKTPLQQLKKVTGMVRTISNLSSTSSKRQFKPQSRRSTPGTPGKYELKSRAFQFGGMEMDFGLGTPDSIRGFRTKSGGPNSRERTKSFNLTNMVVDENSTNVKFKEETGKGKRKVPSDMEVIHKLLKEDFFRDVKGASPSFDSILQRLLTMLDTEDADVHSKVCDYILDLHRDVGISEHYLDRFINKLSHQMNNGAGNLNIRKNGLTALSVIGKSRQDVVASILPRLVDGISELRDEAANALANLTGVTTKDDLFKLMEDMGLQKSYSSKEDEEEALKAIATRLDVPYRSDSFNDWIDGWMADAISPFENAEDLKLQDIDKAWGGREQKWVPESLCLSDATSRASNRLRELSFISDKSRKWSPQVEEKREKTIIEEEQIKDIEAPPTSRASSRHSKRSSKFDPRDPTLYKYYKKRYAMRPGSGKPRERNGKVPSGSFHKLSSYTEDVDSQYMSQESVDVSSGQVGDGVTDTMSTQDSGIVRDLSASLGSQSSKGIPSNVRFSSHSLMKAGRRSKEWLQSKSRLSPVKSSSSLFQQTPHVSKSLRPDDDWQKFFNTPTAMERRRMEMVKRDFTEGRMRQNVPATIHYISDDLPKLPGEAGLRLLHTVRVGDKNVDGVLEKHRVEPIPGKLSSQTKNENEGESRYGILKMKWTTGIPIPARFLESETVIEGDRDSIIYSETASELSQYPSEFKSHDRGGSQSERSHHHDRHSHPSHDRSRDQQRKKKESKSYDTSSKKSKGKKSLLPQLAEKYANKSNTVNVKSNYSDFWTFPTLPGAIAPSPDFVWEHPIPPPPERESRTNIPYIKTEHERYCKYYNLIKKNLHKYTSENGAPTLPKIEVTRALPSKENKKNAELTRGPSLVFPPITLNQLISAK